MFTDSYHWLMKSRKNHPSSSDIWDFRRKWKIDSPQIITSFLKGDWQFDVQKRINKSKEETILLWSSPDALILKVLTCLIQGWLAPFLSRHCYHLKGQGGLKGAVREALKKYPEYPFFVKTDIKDYYTINKQDRVFLAKFYLQFQSGSSIWLRPLGRAMSQWIIITAPAINLGDYVTRWRRWTIAGLAVNRN